MAKPAGSSPRRDAPICRLGPKVPGRRQRVPPALPQARTQPLAAHFSDNLLVLMPLDPQKLDSHTDFDQKFLKIIDEHGWHVMNVVPRAEDSGDAWSYSTGLFYHYKHPEIIVFNEP